MGWVPPAGAAAPLNPPGSVTGGPFIRTHEVNVTLNNGFARTEVDQIFGNTNPKDYEATYSFPLPKDASLSEVSLWIDGQEIIGEVAEKGKARRIYREQVARGNETALAEKNDYKTFDVHIGRIKAGQDTRVRLVYYQPLSVDLNIGRYVYPLAEGGVDEERNDFWSVDNRVRDHFSFNLELKSAFPVKDVRIPGFQTAADIEEISGAEFPGGHYRVALDNRATRNLNKDIVFYYRLADDVPARIELIPYRENEGSDGTFMAIVTPAADLKPIDAGTDWLFVLDASGSMEGDKLGTLADGVSQVLGRMDERDRFHILTFNNNVNPLTRGYVRATDANVRKAIQQVRSIRAVGGTALFRGLQAAYRKADADRTTGMILVTDGVANIGPRTHGAFLEQLCGQDLRLFTFVIGNSANQPLLERLATASGGFAMNLSDLDDIQGRLLQAKAKVLHEAMVDADITFKGE
ncbi:MAG: VIT domain-containing protein, partial [Verrucomicrobiota bacterium]